MHPFSTPVQDRDRAPLPSPQQSWQHDLVSCGGTKPAKSLASQAPKGLVQPGRDGVILHRGRGALRSLDLMDHTGRYRWHTKTKERRTHES